MVKKIFAKSYIWLILILLYLPILLLVAYSFTDTEYIGQWKVFTFDLYVNLFKNTEILVALGNTVIVAISSAVISTILGTAGAIGAFYSRRKVRKAFDFTTQIPIVNAEIVIAVSLAILFGYLGGRAVWTLIAGHVVLSIPFVYTSVKPKLEQMDPSLYEAALDLGCTPTKAMWKVIIPEILPGILSGFLLAITLSLDDFIVTSFTRGNGLLNGMGQIETLSTFIEAHLRRKSWPNELRALASIFFFAIVIGVFAISRKKEKLISKTRMQLRRARQ